MTDFVTLKILGLRIYDSEMQFMTKNAMFFEKKQKNKLFRGQAL